MVKNSLAVKLASFFIVYFSNITAKIFSGFNFYPYICKVFYGAQTLLDAHFSAELRPRKRK